MASRCDAVTMPTLACWHANIEAAIVSLEGPTGVYQRMPTPTTMVETLVPGSERVPRTLRLTRTSSPTTLDAHHEAWHRRRVVAATAPTAPGLVMLYRSVHVAGPYSARGGEPWGSGNTSCAHEFGR
jgi:hypothetical protein